MATAPISKIAPIGKTFGRVTVAGPPIRRKSHALVVPCLCACGDMRQYFISNLTRQKEPMCPSCRLHTRPSRGGFGHPLYNIWKAMIQRCENPKHTHYSSYGGRGISICPRWRNDFTKFVADMGERPSSKHTIDRIDADGHYNPENCRWAPPLVQGNNRRRKFHAIIVWEGRELTRAEAAREAGISKELLHWRLCRGWSIDRAMTQPKRRDRRNQ